MVSISYCADLVRSHDYDRYLCTLFAPAPAREAWFAIFAFNHEVASIPDMVSEEMIGFVRYAWWREALDEIYGGKAVRKHPVVEALAEAVKRFNLPRVPFDALLAEREARFAGDAPTEVKEWEEYFRATSSSLLGLCAHVLKEGEAPTLDTLGMAWGAVGTLRRQASEANTPLMVFAQTMLERAHPLPEAFAAFQDTASFYFKRIQAGKSVGREGAGLLPLYLCWRKLIRKIK